MAQWFCRIDRTEYGPVSTEQLKKMAASGRLSPTDEVRKSEQGPWALASKVKGLNFPSPRSSAPSTETAKSQDRICPGCKSTIASNAVVCVNCGFDRRTGKRHSGLPASRSRMKVVIVLAGSGTLAVCLVGLYLFVFAPDKPTNQNEAKPLAQAKVGSKDPTPAKTTKIDSKDSDNTVHIGEEKKAASDPPKNSKKEASEPQFVSNLAALQKGFHVRGAVRMTVQQRRAAISDITYQQVRLNLDLINDTDARIQLARTMMVIETNAAASVHDGVLVGFRVPPVEKGQETWHSRQAYGLSTDEGIQDNGSRFTGGDIMAMLYLNGSEVTNDSKADVYPLEIAPRSHSSWKLTLNRGNWFQDEMRAAVRVALPEIQVTTATKQLERFRLVVHFSKTPEGWTAAEHQWIRVETHSLAELIDRQTTDPMTRVLAANWAMEIDPKGIRESLIRQCQPLSEGEFLRTCLLLLSFERDPGLSSHAESLLNARSTPTGICITAVVYLTSLGKSPNLATLEATARGNDDKTAGQVIYVLGGLKTAEARRVLQSLLNDPNLAPRHKQIQANLNRQ